MLPNQAKQDRRHAPAGARRPGSLPQQGTEDGRRCSSPRARPVLQLAVRRSRGVALPVPRRWQRRVVASALAAAGVAGPAEVSLLLADDALLHRLNRDFRHIDQPTDVLSFPQLEGHAAGARGAAPAQPLMLGDVVISVERARCQADELGHGLERELGYLLVHGVLHLCGYDHETDEDQAEMRRLEEQALAAVGLARGQPGAAAGGEESATRRADGAVPPISQRPGSGLRLEEQGRATRKGQAPLVAQPSETAGEQAERAGSVS